MERRANPQLHAQDQTGESMEDQRNLARHDH